MKSIEIVCVKRETFGKKANKQLRKTEQVPCVLYGGAENVHFHAHEKSFKELIYSPNVYIVKLKVGDKEYDSILQDIQYHPVNDKINHIDFFEVYPDKKVTIGVPVNLNGHSIGVKEGGKLRLEHRKLKVRGLFHDLPDTIEIDVENLGVGQTVKVSEIEVNNFKIVDAPNTVVASVKITRKTAEATEEGAAGAATTEVKKEETK